MYGSKMRRDSRKPTGRNSGDTGMERRLLINEYREFVCFTIHIRLVDRISVRDLAGLVWVFFKVLLVTFDKGFTSV